MNESECSTSVSVLEHTDFEKRTFFEINSETCVKHGVIAEGVDSDRVLGIKGREGWSTESDSTLGRVGRLDTRFKQEARGLDCDPPAKRVKAESTNAWPRAVLCAQSARNCS